MKRFLLNKGMIVAGACMLVFALGSAAGCSPQQNASEQTESSAADQVAMSGDFEFSADSDCALCHTAEEASATDSACLLGSANHASLTCSGCHSDDSGLASAHDGVAYGDKSPKRLKTTSVDDSICLTCHASYEELAEATASSSVLTDAKGTTVNPHMVSDLNADHDSITCTSCHEAHVEEPVNETALSACSSCHHTNVYECYTCHA